GPSFHVTNTTSIVPRCGAVRSEELDVRVVFVHGACVQDGPWWWHRAAAVLASRGVSSAAPALPSCGESLSSFSGPGPAPFLDVDLDAGTIGVRPEMLAETFMHDSPELVDDATR